MVLIHCTRRYVLAECQLSPAEQEVLSAQEAEVVAGSSKPLYAALARLRHLVGSATPRLGEQVGGRWSGCLAALSGTALVVCKGASIAPAAPQATSRSPARLALSPHSLSPPCQPPV